MCVSTSSGLVGVVLVSRLVFRVLTTSPSINSLGENFSEGSSQWLSMQIVFMKWSGQFLGRLLMFILCQLFSPSSGVHRRARTYINNLFVPFMRPLTHGEYAGMTCILIPDSSQNSVTLWLVK
jgi:hypothetical protein